MLNQIRDCHEFHRHQEVYLHGHVQRVCIEPGCPLSRKADIERTPPWPGVRAAVAAAAILIASTAQASELTDLLAGCAGIDPLATITCIVETPRPALKCSTGGGYGGGIVLPTMAQYPFM